MISSKIIELQRVDCKMALSFRLRDNEKLMLSSHQNSQVVSGWRRNKNFRNGLFHVVDPSKTIWQCINLVQNLIMVQACKHPGASWQDSMVPIITEPSFHSVGLMGVTTFSGSVNILYTNFFLGLVTL